MSPHDGARMDLQSLEGHRRILGIVFIVMNALTLLVALGFGAFGLAMGHFGIQHARADEQAVVTAVLAGVTGCLFVMGLPGIITGIGLLKRRPWSRTLALVLGCLALPNVPLGTALGIYTIWFYTQAGSDQVFE
jgi:hypothetical protein